MEEKDIKINKFIFINSMIWIIYAFGFNTMSYTLGVIFSGFYICLFLTKNLEQKYYMILFALPFAAIFKISPSLPATLIILYMIFLLEWARIKLKIYKWEIVIISFLVSIQIFHIIRFNADIKGIIAQLVNIIFMFALIKFFFTSKKKHDILQKASLIFSCSLSVSIVIADILPKIPYIVLREKQTLLMSINRFSGLNGDPNYYSQLILAAASLMIIYIVQAPKRKEKILGVLLCIFLIINGFRSVSKSYALTFIGLVALLIFIFLIAGTIKEKNRWKTFWKIFFGVGLGSVIIYLLAKSVIIPLIESRTDAGDFFTGRTEIWINYIKSLYFNTDILLFGVGFGNSANVYNEFYNVVKAPHNVYIELIYELGIVGCGLVCILCRNIFIKFSKLILKYDGIYIVSLMITSVGLALSSNDAVFILLPLIVLGGKCNETTIKRVS